METVAFSLIANTERYLDKSGESVIFSSSSIYISVLSPFMLALAPCSRINISVAIFAKVWSVLPPQALMSVMSSYPLSSAVLTASIVSVSSLWAGERIVSILSGNGFSRLSKSPKIRSGLIPACSALSYPLSAHIINAPSDISAFIHGSGPPQII